MLCVTALGALGASLAGPTTALAYDTSTHRIISRAAARMSRIFSGEGAPGAPLFQALGYGSPSAAIFPVSTDDSLSRAVLSLSPVELVELGANNEDERELLRVFNHFFDPQHDGRGLTVGREIGNPSPSWALEDRGEVSANGVSQRFSYRDAQRLFYDSLTLSTRNDRLFAFGGVLLRLGHVIHHIQDMAQPQHTRNDPHSPANGKKAQFYEMFTKQRNADVESLYMPLSYPAVGFSNARQFWTDNRVAYRGMADFSSRNYVSFGTNYGIDPNLVFRAAPHPEFPLPNGFNVIDNTPKKFETRSTWMRLADGTTRIMPMKYLVGSIYDQGSGLTVGGAVSTPNKLLAALSLLDGPLTRAGRTPVFALDENVFTDNYPILLPRARAFSTGLINHFFRGVGGMRAERMQNDVWRVTGQGPLLAGEFAFYWEDLAGTRTPITTRTASLLPGVSFDATLGPPPASAQRLAIAFRGQIADEVPSDPGFSAVAGLVIAIPAPPSPGSPGFPPMIPPQTCSTPSSCNRPSYCNRAANCLCYKAIDNSNVCAKDVVCAQAKGCASMPDCPSGSVCVKSLCCNLGTRGVCQVACPQ